MRRESRFFRSTTERTITYLVGLLLLVLPSCARNHYHRAADRDTYNVLGEKTCWRPWQLPGDYAINVDPRSRLFDPSDPNDPMLPHPGPHLYAYQLPELSGSWDAAPAGPEPIPLPQNEAPSEMLPEPADTADLVDGPVRLASAAEVDGLGGPSYGTDGLRVLSAVHISDDAENPEDSPSSSKPYDDIEEGLPIQPIPPAYWDSLPRSCLSRMLEFESVRGEYRRSFETEPPETLHDPSRKLTLNNIVELAYLNSREYQAQKEGLYIAALGLTLERYDYLCRFSVGGNGVDVNYDHFRTDGVTTNTLAVPSSLQANKMVALGGTFVTRFANNVVLTFNGPQGFADDISSNLLFDFTQSIFQRDVLLEPLIQSERNVVYAARNFARYRREFFYDLARQYYTVLLSTYRGIEINTQNYFANVRQLNQFEAEVRAGITKARPRVEIDQSEQSMLNGRSTLITTCNNLEGSLDRLKLTLGLPTETPINIDLRELEELTRRDEIEVKGELVRRAWDRVDLQLSSEIPDREETLSAAIVLTERILDWVQLRDPAGQNGVDEGQLRMLRVRLRVDEAYEAVDRVQRLLATAKKPPAVPINVFRSTMNLVQARLQLVARQLQLADQLAIDSSDREVALASYIVQKDSLDAILKRVASFLEGDDSEDLAALQPDVEAILRVLEDLDATARRMVRVPETRPDAQTELQQAKSEARQLLETTDRLASDARGLTSIELSVDDAMVTALVQRFELMNERGFLADDWRSIKLAADDLKSVLNLNVRQSLRTRDNQPFAFSFDDSRTELSASLDLPLNRQQQRNGFRRSLISYQAGRRGLMAREDSIKFEVRQGLRQLDLDRVQYGISIISAALASERVYSTQLELALGLGNTNARDALEALNAYRQSVTRVANGRLDYVVNRAKLALDLELMMLDDAGFWPELNNEDYQPSFNPVYPADADPTYGDLPYGVWPSKKIKRMRNVPPPGYEVIGVGQPVDGTGEAETADERQPVPME